MFSGKKENSDKKTKKMSGIVCPKCGCADFRDEAGRPWDVVKVFPIPGSVRRNKECRNCGKRIRTREFLDKEIS